MWKSLKMFSENILVHTSGLEFSFAVLFFLLAFIFTKEKTRNGKEAPRVTSSSCGIIQ